MPEESGRGCRGKVAYLKRNEAAKQVEALRRRTGGDESRSLAVYHCPTCGAYHYGRDPKRAGRGHGREHVFLDYRGKARRYWELMRGEA